ncbi:MAG TPA: M35 family metallo-endopeptidase [Burkholderiaceae bacterium]
MTDAAAPTAAAPAPDYFEQLGEDAKHVFPPAPAQGAPVECPCQALARWRAQNKASITQALAGQRQMLLDKKAALARWNDADQAAFQKSFGTTTDAAKATIAGRIDRMLDLNSKMTVDNFVLADPSKAGRFAFVHRDDMTHTVNIDGEFYDSPMTGIDSKPGALSHEMSHFTDIGDTFDKFDGYNADKPVYGPDASHLLAQTRPDLALQHADSFEYYLEGAP